MGIALFFPRLERRCIHFQFKGCLRWFPITNWTDNESRLYAICSCATLLLGLLGPDWLPEYGATKLTGCIFTAFAMSTNSKQPHQVHLEACRDSSTALDTSKHKPFSCFQFVLHGCCHSHGSGVYGINSLEITCYVDASTDLANVLPLPRRAGLGILIVNLQMQQPTTSTSELPCRRPTASSLPRQRPLPWKLWFYTGWNYHQVSLFFSDCAQLVHLLNSRDYSNLPDWRMKIHTQIFEDYTTERGLKSSK
jgi:hypothetical protein